MYVLLQLRLHRTHLLISIVVLTTFVTKSINILALESWAMLFLKGANDIRKDINREKKEIGIKPSLIQLQKAMLLGSAGIL